ncbi:MAG: hypothetical protein JRC68_02100 [Deltaproteobacteria bacterium]|nr:hypothetical protein [Deltaproteobacteria bacterium]
MTTSAASASISKPIVKWLLWIFCIVLFIFALLGASLYFLPGLISTEWFRQRVEHQAFQIIQRPTHIEKLHWTWSRGILLRGLQIADDPAFSDRPLIRIEHASLTVDLMELFRRRLVFDLELKGLDAGLVRNPDGQTNIDLLLNTIGGPEKPKPEPGPKKQRSRYPALIFDIQGRIQLSDASIQVKDHAQDHVILVRDISLLLEVPSLLQKPVNLTITAKAELDGRPLPPARLTVRVENLITPDAFLDPSQAAVIVKADLPGVRIDLRGALRDKGMQGKVRLNMAALASAARPILGSALPDLSGSIELDVDVSGNDGESIRFAANVIGKDLVVSGGPLKEGQTGPVSFGAFHGGTVDLSKGILKIREGEIWLQDHNRISWHGTVNHLKGPNPVSDLTIGPLYLDLKEIHALAKGFVPAGIARYHENKTGMDSSRLQIKEIRFKGPIPSGPNQVELEGLSLTLPYIRINTPAIALKAEHINLIVQQGGVILESLFPTRATASASLDIRNIHLKAGEEIWIKRLDLPLLDLRASDIAVSPEALFGISGKFVVHESGEIKGLIATSRASVPELHHSLTAECLLDQGHSARVDVNRIAISAPRLRIEGIFHEPVETGIEIESGVTGIHLHGLNPLRMDVQKLHANLDIEKLLQARMSAHALNLGSERLETRGTISVNLGNLTSLIPPDLMPQVSMNGTMGVDFQFQGRLPGKDEIVRLTDRNVSLVERLRQTGFIENLEVNTSLNNLGVDLSLGDSSALKVSNISSLVPLKLSLNNGLKKGKIHGEIVFNRIEELPSFGRLDQPMKVTLSFSFAQENLKTVHFSETMKVDSLNVNQSLRLSLYNIDQILSSGSRSPLSTLLEKVDGLLSMSIQADLDTDQSRFIEGLSLQGDLDAGAEVHLEGGREIMFKGRLESPGLDVRVGDIIRISNLKTHINLEKKYVLAREIDSANISSSPPLSMEVLSPHSKKQTLDKYRNSAARRLMDDLRGRLAPKRSISFDSAGIKAGPVLLEISNHELEFRLVRNLPHIDYFQMDLMGGTVVGSLSISEKDKTFVLESRCSLSGLNANRLIPGIIQGVPDEEAELTGQLYLWLPISADPGQLLNDLQVSVDLTHIGARTLERLLYAMDPYESNEAIVKQRKLLKIGTPRWVRLKIRHGTLSLSGEIEAKGIRLDLPKIERLNIANMSIGQQMENNISRLGAVNKLLKMISAENIFIDPKDNVRLDSDL